jgi:hypothetical protein
VSYESAHKRFVDARKEYQRLESELAAARFKMNQAERECSAAWLKVLAEAERRAALPPADHQPTEKTEASQS